MSTSTRRRNSRPGRSALAERNRKKQYQYRIKYMVLLEGLERAYIPEIGPCGVCVGRDWCIPLSPSVIPADEPGVRPTKRPRGCQSYAAIVQAIKEANATGITK